MLCGKCETAIQAAVTESKNTKDGIAYATVHQYHHTFLDSLLQGCLFCRQIFRQNFNNKYQDVPISSLTECLDVIERCRSKWTEGLLSSLGDPSVEALRASVSLIRKESLPGRLDRLLQLWDYKSPFIWCKVFYASLKDAYDVESYSKSESDSESYSQVSLKDRKGTLFASLNLSRTVKTEDGPTLLAGNSFFQRESTCTSDCPDLWRHWLRICSETHDQCQALHKDTTFFPARIIKICSNENDTDPKWRLTTQNEVAPAPYSYPPYLTLSHCWGPPGTVHTRLTKATFDRFRLQEQLVVELPKTYQDAIGIAVSLGFRYIWIDSLCIMQDPGDTTDWEEQSSVMGLIYKHATCNIAATWAADGSQGCFSQRDAAIVAPTTISLGDEEFHIAHSHIFYYNIGGAPLNRRGWVLQERFLARRQLNFAKDAVFWECPQLVALEQFPDGIPKAYCWDLMNGAKPRIDFTSLPELRRGWAHLVHVYSRTKLTVCTDKPVAIAGLVGELKARLDDDYLAGLWQKDLHKQLCWYTSIIPTASTNPDMAPTWSWMKYSDTPIFADDRYLKDDEHTTAYFLEILDVTVKDKPVPHGSVSGTLRIRGIVMWVRLTGFGYSALEPPTEHDPGPVFTELDNASGMIFVGWDERSEIKEDLLVVFVAGYCVGSRDPGYFVKGLLLAPGTEGDSTFTRVGMFYYYEGDRFLRLIINRLGLEPAEMLAETEGLRLGYGLGMDGTLRDPRLDDIIQEVTIV